MKPRTTAPAPLLADLKRYASNHLVGDIACQLLALDPDVDRDASPMDHARALAWISYYLAKRGVTTGEFAVDCEEKFKDPRAVRLFLSKAGEETAELGELQRRIGRAIRALLPELPKDDAA